MKLLKLLFGNKNEAEKPPEKPQRTIQQKAFVAGFHARENNYSIDYNPYRKGGTLHENWEKGWRFADSFTRK